MTIKFLNLDKDLIKLRPEPMGEIQPKFWFSQISTRDKVLVKRQHRERVNGQREKSKMYNHFGEYFAYMLAQKTGIEACPVDLITLHDTKNKYSKTKHLYMACASHCVRKPNDYIYPGEHVIARYMAACPNEFEYRYKGNFNPNEVSIKEAMYTKSHEDNVDIIIDAVASETRNFEMKSGKRTPEQIEEDVDKNVQDTINMIVFDCVLGNSDRHSENWAMRYNDESGKLDLYPMYDNEAVLGLRKPVAEIKRVVSQDRISEYANIHLFSRMGVHPNHSGISYRSMLNHLVTYYPKQAIKAMGHITASITEQDLTELYDSALKAAAYSDDHDIIGEEGNLPEEYKTFGLALYRERSEFAKELIREAKAKDEMELC